MKLNWDELDIGQKAIDQDHEALVGLLETARSICSQPVGTRDCGICTLERQYRCRSEMNDFGQRLMILLLDHFQREDMLMDLLPRTREVQAHCEKHRSDHLAFSVRYNRIVVGLPAGDVVKGIAELESLLIAWVREHALKLDADLAGLLQRLVQVPGTGRDVASG